MAASFTGQDSLEQRWSTLLSRTRLGAVRDEREGCQALVLVPGRGARRTRSGDRWSRDRRASLIARPQRLWGCHYRVQVLNVAAPMLCGRLQAALASTLEERLAHVECPGLLMTYRALWEQASRPLGAQNAGRRVQRPRRAGLARAGL